MRTHPCRGQSQVAGTAAVVRQPGCVFDTRLGQVDCLGRFQLTTADIGLQRALVADHESHGRDQHNRQCHRQQDVALLYVRAGHNAPPTRT